MKTKNEENELRIYNTLVRKKEIFNPIEKNKIKMYVCGLTVYDFCHIGNARVFVFFDMVVRYLRFLGYDVVYVRNITDVDDKIINKAIAENKSYDEISEYFLRAFREDLNFLRLDPPTFEPKVTEHINDIINIIKLLQNGDYIYTTDTGDVCFDVTKFKDYGKLSNENLYKLKKSNREIINGGKKNELDFVLWKQSKKNDPYWDSPWGRGRPGWHIECSAMSQHYFGNTFDVHCGGMDLKFPHHENEIAQSESAYGCKFVNYWMHVGLISINKSKMSKSLGNIVKLRDVLKNFHEETIKYFLLSSHYRSPLEYSDENLKMAHLALTKLYLTIKDLKKIEQQIVICDEIALNDNVAIENKKIILKYFDDFIAALADDFNTPIAFSKMFDLAKYINKSVDKLHKIHERSKKNVYEIIFAMKILKEKMGKIIGILQSDPNVFLKTQHNFHKHLCNSILAENDIQFMLNERNIARTNKDWKKSDEIRHILLKHGIVLEDRENGETSWRYS